MPITEETVRERLSTLMARAEEDGDRPPETLGLMATADGPIVAAGLSRRRAMYFPIEHAERITGEPEKVQPGYAVVGLHKDDRAGLKDPAVFAQVESFYLIRRLKDGADDIVNAEYVTVRPGSFRHTSHNRDHLVRDPQRAVEYYRFGPV